MNLVSGHNRPAGHGSVLDGIVWRGAVANEKNVYVSPAGVRHFLWQLFCETVFSAGGRVEYGHSHHFIGTARAESEKLTEKAFYMSRFDRHELADNWFLARRLVRSVNSSVIIRQCTVERIRLWVTKIWKRSG